MDIPKITKENKMSGFKALVGRKMTKNVKFMNEEIKISKLTVAEVLDIQAKAKKMEQDENLGFDVLKTVIRAAVDGAADLSDEDFESLPMDELSKLSAEIMKFSGVGQDQGK